MGSRRARLALLAAGVASAIGVASAGAAPLEKGNFHETDTEVIEDFCGDLTVAI